MTTAVDLTGTVKKRADFNIEGARAKGGNLGAMLSAKSDVRAARENNFGRKGAALALNNI